jgi:chlorophyll synthase
MTAARPDWRIIALAALYSAGAHGIMTLNDFKSVTGDRRMGIASLPASLGIDPAARVACLFMAVPQAMVAALLTLWGQPLHAGMIALLLMAQLALMARLLRNPGVHAARYNATGTTLYVLGMLTAACAVRLVLAPP